MTLIKNGTSAFARGGSGIKSGGDLLSRDVAIQVSSALRSLTSVFGMGTGVSFSSFPPDICSYSCLTICYQTSSASLAYTPSKPYNAYAFLFFPRPGITCKLPLDFLLHLLLIFPDLSWSSPRPISTSQLNALLHLHPWPIYHVVCMGSYP